MAGWAMVTPAERDRRAWAMRVDASLLGDLAQQGDRERLAALGAGLPAAVPAALRYPLLLHPESAESVVEAPPPPTLSEAGRQLYEALGDSEGQALCELWNGAFCARAARVGHRFDLYADYLAEAREFVLTGLLALPAVLPPRRRPDDTTGQLIETLAGGMRAGAMKYADRALYRLTKQMVREGVLVWRDERGRVQEHACLRTTVDDPAPLVAEREFRRELKAFVARYGPRLLGWRTWERFRLHYFEDWTQAAIAAHQGVTQQAVSESLATAACRLRAAFLEPRAVTPRPAAPTRPRSARRRPR